MRHTLLLALVLAGAAPRADLDWWVDLKEATELAAKSGKPLFIVFR